MSLDKTKQLQSNIVATYDYYDEEDNLVYQCIRYNPKKFRQRRPHGNNYIWGISAGEYKKGTSGDYYRRSTFDPPHLKYVKFQALEKHYPYKLKNLLKSKFIILVEGEKDVDTLEKIGFFATTNSGGVSFFPKEITEYFKDKYVAILADNDKAGKYGAEKRAKALISIAKQIKIIYTLPNLKEHEDVTDWIKSSFSKNPSELSDDECTNAHNILYNIIKNTKPWSYQSKETIDKTTFLKTPKKINKTTNSIRDFLEKLNSVRPYGKNHWLAQCPYHKDDTNSLSITLKQNKILVYCFAGCRSHQILNRLNLTWADLFIDE